MSYMSYTYNKLIDIDNYHKWEESYKKNLKDLYEILNKNLKNNNIKYKTIDFTDFCIFIYNNSSKRIIEI